MAWTYHSRVRFSRPCFHPAFSPHHWDRWWWGWRHQMKYWRGLSDLNRSWCERRNTAAHHPWYEHSSDRRPTDTLDFANLFVTFTTSPYNSYDMRPEIRPFSSWSARLCLDQFSGFHSWHVWLSFLKQGWCKLYGQLRWLARFFRTLRSSVTCCSFFAPAKQYSRL